MAKGKINALQCPKCGEDGSQQYYRYCRKCQQPYVMVARDKREVSGDFDVVDWFSSRSSAGLIVEDKRSGQRYSIYMSDVFELIKGTRLTGCTLEETKKGSAYGWKVITKEEAV